MANVKERKNLNIASASSKGEFPLSDEELQKLRDAGYRGFSPTDDAFTVKDHLVHSHEMWLLMLDHAFMIWKVLGRYPGPSMNSKEIYEGYRVFPSPQTVCRLATLEQENRPKVFIGSLSRKESYELLMKAAFERNGGHDVIQAEFFSDLSEPPAAPMASKLSSFGDDELAAELLRRLSEKKEKHGKLG